MAPNVMQASVTLYMHWMAFISNVSLVLNNLLDQCLKKVSVVSVVMQVGIFPPTASICLKAPIIFFIYI